MDYAARKFSQHLKLTHEELMALGRVNPADKSEPFCMTVLALKFSRAANGVSELHGAVSREMWQCLYPGKTVDQVPIGHITNGVHVAGWMKGTARGFWRRKLNGNGEKHDWANDINTPEFWNKLADDKFISDEELWALRYKLRRELLEFTRRRLLLQNQTFRQGDFIAFDQFLNPDALTIGFARRFATYKRAPLIFEQLENIVKLTRDEQRPVQFIFAGKAHPRDDAGKSFIQKIIHLSKFSDLKGSLVFIENYDVHVARQMVSGCDIWLNNPRRPLEASGTSGMKAGCHGCLGLSIMDGWWREGFDGTNGFSIGDDTHPESLEEQDRRDSSNLFKALTEEVVPTFYNRDANGIPRDWIKKIRRAMVTLVPQFSTWRMVQEYTTKFYQPK
jgi:starch phosphorylase